MSTAPTNDSQAVLSVSGQAADHLYREGSKKASFWEALFGSSLRAGDRTHISSLPDGTRVFEVPVAPVEHELLRSAQVWMTSEENAELCKEAASLLSTKQIRVRLVGRQPQGHAIASFALLFEPKVENMVVPPAVPGAFRSWFGAEGSQIATETLIPFGFTPEH